MPCRNSFRRCFPGSAHVPAVTQFFRRTQIDPSGHNGALMIPPASVPPATSGLIFPVLPPTWSEVARLCRRFCVLTETGAHDEAEQVRTGELPTALQALRATTGLPEAEIDRQLALVFRRSRIGSQTRPYWRNYSPRYCATASLNRRRERPHRSIQDRRRKRRLSPIRHALRPATSPTSSTRCSHRNERDLTPAIVGAPPEFLVTSATAPQPKARQHNP